MFISFDELEYGDYFIDDDGDIGKKILLNLEGCTQWAIILYTDGTPFKSPQRMDFGGKYKKIGSPTISFTEEVIVQKEKVVVEDVVIRQNRTVKL